MTGAPTVDIPGPVLDILRLWRPTPLVRATPPRSRRSARRRASTSRTSRCRPPVRTSRTPRSRRRTTTSRTARRASRPRPAPGSGARALAFACAQFDLECKVYMVRASYEQKPYRRVLMETWGADGRAVAGRRARSSRFARRRDQRRGARRRDRATTRTTRSARCSTTCCCTRRSSGSKRRSSSRSRARPGPTS